MLRIGSRGPRRQPHDLAQFKDATAEPLIRLISDCGDDDRATSLIYSLTTQVLCAKSVPNDHADAVGIALLRTPTLTPRVWI